MARGSMLSSDVITSAISFEFGYSFCMEKNGSITRLSELSKNDVVGRCIVPITSNCCPST